MDLICFYNRFSDFYENFILELWKIYNIINDIIYRGVMICLFCDIIRIAILIL